MKFAIDTNVAISANGRDTHAELKCQLRCLEFLQEIASSRSKMVVVLDEGGKIIKEYGQHLNYHGQPGVGDLFYKFLHDNMYHDNGKVELVVITPTQDQNRGYEELPVNALDPSDRKFLATATVSGAEIVNALDTDWHEQAALLTSLGINIQQLCPDQGCLVS